MFSRLKRPASSQMDVQILLDNSDPVYTTSQDDSVSGRIFLHSESSVPVSTVHVALVGVATSRLGSGKRIESHRLLHKTQQVFPPCRTSHSLTLGPGTHAFPFSIPFPQASECYKSSMRDGRSRASGCRADIRPRSWRTVHLLRKLPPSTGDQTAAAEVTYSLHATATTGGFLKGEKKTWRPISFFPMSNSSPPADPITERCLITLDSGTTTPTLLKRHETASCSENFDHDYQVDVEVANGACLLLDHPIPLNVHITKLRNNTPADHDAHVFFNDFQSMLIETTHVRAKTSTETSEPCHIVQTMSNMRRLVFPADTPAGARTSLHNDIPIIAGLPRAVTSTFEMCNITRSYKLEIRLGFQFGVEKTRILEVRFPVCIISPPSLGRRTSSITDPSPAYDEKGRFE